MSIKFTCDDKQTLVSYLYGEVDHETRQAVDAHLDACAACAAEVTALGDVRSELGLWVPPDVELDFTIVKKSRAAAGQRAAPGALVEHRAGVGAGRRRDPRARRGRRDRQPAGASPGPEGFSVSTGWMAPRRASPERRRPIGAADRTARSKRALVSLEQQLRSEIRSTREQETRVAARTPVDEATIRRVQQLIAASEQRHEQRARDALRRVHARHEHAAPRRPDEDRPRHGDYDEQLLRQRQMINNVIRVSATPQQ